MTKLIGIAGTSLSRTNGLAEAAHRRTDVFCGGQAYVGALARTRRVRALALDIAGNTGIVNPVFRPQFADKPTTKQQWRVPPCPGDRRL